MTQLTETLSKADELRLARKERKPEKFVTADLFTPETVAIMTPESLTAHLNYFQELVALAGVARDFDTVDILNRAIGEIKTFQALGAVTPAESDVPRGTIEPEPPQEPVAPGLSVAGETLQEPLEDPVPADEPRCPAPEDAEKAEQFRKTMAVLDKHGIQPHMLPGADDNDLLQINGIGQRRLDMIRAVYPKANA